MGVSLYTWLTVGLHKFNLKDFCYCGAIRDERSSIVPLCWFLFRESGLDAVRASNVRRDHTRFTIAYNIKDPSLAWNKHWMIWTWPTQQLLSVRKPARDSSFPVLFRLLPPLFHLLRIPGRRRFPTACLDTTLAAISRSVDTRSWKTIPQQFQPARWREASAVTARRGAYFRSATKHYVIIFQLPWQQSKFRQRIHPTRNIYWVKMTKMTKTTRNRSKPPRPWLVHSSPHASSSGSVTHFSGSSPSC